MYISIYIYIHYIYIYIYIYITCIVPLEIDQFDSGIHVAVESAHASPFKKGNVNAFFAVALLDGVSANRLANNSNADGEKLLGSEELRSRVNICCSFIEDNVFISLSESIFTLIVSVLPKLRATCETRFAPYKKHISIMSASGVSCTKCTFFLSNSKMKIEPAANISTAAALEIKSLLIKDSMA